MEKITEILLLAFLSITFLQSGLDKVIDWKGNLDFIKSHFAKTFLKNSVPALLGIVLFIEIVAGILSLAGIWELFKSGASALGFYGAILSCVALLMLLFGQRVAKDYEGAKTIVIYFIPTIFTVFLLQ
ncbi:DoxX family protein [Ascidiimonas sp. W6]|uniref:DoxX family protein n=1 Tax=Ascidiimonas meishanensis TaxID=3128903 RepID=UPI0030EEDC99